MVVPAYASDNTGLEFQQFIDEFAGEKDFFEVVSSNRDFIVSVAAAAFGYRQVEEAKRQTDKAKRQADEAKRQADEAFKASPEGKIRAAVAKAMEPFEPTRKEDEVIKRPVMDTIKNRIKNWRYNATIIGDRFQSGKSVAVEEALRGVRGVCAIHHQERRLGEGDVQATEGGWRRNVRRGHEPSAREAQGLSRQPH